MEANASSEWTTMENYSNRFTWTLRCFQHQKGRRRGRRRRRYRRHRSAEHAIRNRKEKTRKGKKNNGAIIYDCVLYIRSCSLVCGAGAMKIQNIIYTAQYRSPLISSHSHSLLYLTHTGKTTTIAEKRGKRNQKKLRCNLCICTRCGRYHFIFVSTWCFDKRMQQRTEKKSKTRNRNENQAARAEQPPGSKCASGVESSTRTRWHRICIVSR